MFHKSRIPVSHMFEETTIRSDRYHFIDRRYIQRLSFEDLRPLITYFFYRVGTNEHH